MPYSSIDQLPKQFSQLPVKARRIAMHVINSILKTEKDETSAFKQAWAAIKKQYTKQGNIWIANNDNAAIFSPIGSPHIIAFNSSSNTLMFDVIAQTEGVHTDVSGKSISYTPELLINSAPSAIGKNLYWDPGHKQRLAGNSDERPDVAEVTDTEVKKINEQMIKDFELNSSMLDRYALVWKVTGYDPIWNDKTRNGEISHISSELQFVGDKDNNGIYNPTNIIYQGGILLDHEGADPGAVLLNIYNTKYGGDSMPEDENGDGKNTTPEGQPSVDSSKPVEELKKEVEEAKTTAEQATKEKEVAEAANEKLQKEIEELKADNEKYKKKIDKANNSSDDVAKKVAELERENEEIKKSLDTSNDRVQHLVNEKRKTVLNDLALDEKYISKVLEQNLDDEAFNTKVEEIKSLKDLGKKEAEASNDTGVVKPFDAANESKEFESNFGMSKEDFIEKELGVKLT